MVPEVAKGVSEEVRRSAPGALETAKGVSAETLRSVPHLVGRSVDIVAEVGGSALKHTQVSRAKLGFRGFAPPAPSRLRFPAYGCTRLSKASSFHRRCPHSIPRDGCVQNISSMIRYTMRAGGGAGGGGQP
jgi:hypothetical protein